MGLAASQARFLGLTARKSNAEYRAQQINQQRTALSNEVSRMYDDYNKLTVPVPPSSTDYTKTVYKLDNASEDYQVKSYEKITDTTSPYYGYYSTTLEYEDTVPKAFPSVVGTTLNVQGNYDEQTGEFTSLSNIDFVIGTDEYTYDSQDEENSTLKKITVQEGDDVSKYQGLSTVMESLGLKSGTFYYYEKNNTNYYTTENDLLTTAYDLNQDNSAQSGVYTGQYSFTYQGTTGETKDVSAIAAFDENDNGRLSAIRIIKCDDDMTLVGNTYSITTSSEDDEKGYQDALNEYNYKKDLYEKEVDRINNKTKQIQEQDRELELQLDEIDTEQNALSTEMDSVKKVIEDTVESVFKTFQS